MVGRHRVPLLVLATTVTVLACRTPPPPGAVATTDPRRVHALLLNGGGAPAMNYASHLRHVEHMHDVLLAAGIPAERTVALSSDGADPGLDLATRESEVPAANAWLLRGTPLADALKPPIVQANSLVPGLSLTPATRETLASWAGRAARSVQAGDTVVVFVTDHGTRNPRDPGNNRITLWGDGQAITVRALRRDLDRLDPGARVVTVMAQCFSGSFANLRRRRDGRGPENVCGYFSTTADRLAYGCYPENRNRDDVGYAFHFLRALRGTGDFDAAHRSALITDDSPDVPLRTSDAYLEEVVRTAATAATQDPAAFADSLLAGAFADRASWERDLRLLDAIGERYGVVSPRRVAEVEQQLTVVPALADELTTHRKNWTHSCGSAALANLDRFLTARADWRAKLSSDTLGRMAAAERRTLRGTLLTDLESFTGTRTPVGRRLRSLGSRADESGTLAYRMETRTGVLMRMRLLLYRIAGLHYVRTTGTPEERATLERLLACEQVVLPIDTAPPEDPPAKEPFPSFEDDVVAAARVVPGWLGVQYKPVSERTRRALDVDLGAATVQAVYPESPAKAAGVAVGDVIIGPPGTPFAEPQQLREWVMTAPLDDPQPLELVRAGERRTVALALQPYPRKWPELPGPPKAGSAAPTLGLTPYRGTPPGRLAGANDTLLFFWATWCGICKAALPALDDASKRLGMQVVAITDEEPEQLDAFFSGYGGPFPPVVAIDESRRSFLDYGVSGTPTFVLIGADGRIVRQKTGYAAKKGLEVLKDS